MAANWSSTFASISKAVLLTGLAIAASAVPAQAAAPHVTVAFQVMDSTGLAARRPFEAWFVFDKSSDPTVPGYSVPAGATIRFTFPKSFTPRPGLLESVMLSGWAQGAIPAKFTAAIDDKDARTAAIRFVEGIEAGPPERPGLKAIHLRTSLLNPPHAGDYPITIRFADAGPLTGTTQAIAHITARPVPNIAAYNHLHRGKDEDWQRVKPGAEAPLPIDFLVTLPGDCRSSISLRPVADGDLAILSDGKRIGSITTEGVPLTLTPQQVGPGFARLGIIEVHAKAEAMAGTARIIAALDRGSRDVIHVIVEPQ